MLGKERLHRAFPGSVATFGSTASASHTLAGWVHWLQAGCSSLSIPACARRPSFGHFRLFSRRLEASPIRPFNDFYRRRIEDPRRLLLQISLDVSTPAWYTFSAAQARRCSSFTLPVVKDSFSAASLCCPTRGCFASSHFARVCDQGNSR